MKIKTITCHDVYNLGASLQAYALSVYLTDCGHDVQIINYKPVYLQHYRLTGVPNPAYDKPFLREAYQIAKFPGRLYERLTSRRKKAFDVFTEQYLPVTKQMYVSCEDLRRNIPEADVYIAGSDQIWNPVFKNGHDPSFFLQFVSAEKKKIAYAASFAVDVLSAEDQMRMKSWLRQFEAISVRESSGLKLLENMGLQGTQVVDPVFLLGAEQWEKVALKPTQTDYILVYDFDKSILIKKLALKLARKTGMKIVSVFPMEDADLVWSDMGPREFLGAVQNAELVLSNSFHASAFSLIFHKEFYVVNRQEKINTRMRDLLESLGLSERLISDCEEIGEEPILWEETDALLEMLISESKKFLKEQI